MVRHQNAIMPGNVKDDGLYDVKLDQALAKDLLRTGGFLLILGVPTGFIVGLDQQVLISFKIICIGTVYSRGNIRMSVRRTTCPFLS